MIIATSYPKRFNILSWLIAKVQGTKFSHVLIIDERINLVFQASHGYVNAQNTKIFVEENIIIDKYKVPDSSVNYDFIISNLGVPYGKMQLVFTSLHLLFKWRFKDNGNQYFICSEFVGRALKLDWVNDSTTPKEIHDYLMQHSVNSDLMR